MSELSDCIQTDSTNLCCSLIPIQEEDEEKSKSNRISNLPDDVLLHIISFLYNGNTKLRDLWNSVTVEHEEGSIYAMAIATLRFVASAIDWGRPLNWSRKLVFHSLGSGHVLVATKTAYSSQDHSSYKMFSWAIHTRLRKLSIIDCFDVNSVKIRGHNLSSFHYRGRCPYIEMKSARISGMDEVMLDLREEPMSVNVPLKNLLNIAPNNIDATRYMTLCIHKVVIRPLLTPILGLNILEELWWIAKSMDEENIDSLISLLQECRCLKKLFVTVDPTCYCISSSDRCKRHKQKKSPNSKPLHSLDSRVGQNERFRA